MVSKESYHEIMFSQVREDPLIEINALNPLTTLISNDNDNNNDNKLNVFMIASGGCTLFSIIAASNVPISFDIIDSNISQFHLINLKMAIMKYMKTSNDVISFFQGQLSQIEYRKILTNILELKLLTKENYDFWETNIDLVYRGINQTGIFEELFKTLSENNFNFDKVFNRNYLIEKFGESAVIHSANKQFTLHFQEVLESYPKRSYSPHNNYFYHQILYNNYSSDKDADLPYYITHFDAYISHLSKHVINQSHCNIKDFHFPPNKYHLIHLSNLTDWMNLTDIHSIFKSIHLSLKIGGKVIIRRLNGDYNLLSLMSEYFSVIDVTPLDKSCFYSEVVIGTKCSDNS
jgi:S-adenosylmethionine:diacylglycerol 3-amino-3-carboxypropyl transferase